MSFLEDSGMLIRETLKLYDCLGVYSRKYKQEYRVVNVWVRNRMVRTLERQNFLKLQLVQFDKGLYEIQRTEIWNMRDIMYRDRSIRNSIKKKEGIADQNYGTHFFQGKRLVEIISIAL